MALPDNQIVTMMRPAAFWKDIIRLLDAYMSNYDPPQDVVKRDNIMKSLRDELDADAEGPTL